MFYLALVILSFVGMEFMAWFTHKYIMHGLLWNWHEDHHKPHHEKNGFFEKNDLFFSCFCDSKCYPLYSRNTGTIAFLIIVCWNWYQSLWPGILPNP